MYSFFLSSPPVKRPGAEMSASAAAIEQLLPPADDTTPPTDCTTYTDNRTVCVCVSVQRVNVQCGSAPLTS